MPQTWTRAVVGTVIALGTIAMGLPGCSDSPSAPGPEPEIMSFEEDDAEMNAAMDEARKTVEEFVGSLNATAPSQSGHSVKMGFRDANGSEFIWLSDVRYENGMFSGAVGNTPQIVETVEFGQPVTIAKDKIADWLFIEDGKLVGGYTMRVMRNRLSPEERTELDASLPFTVD